jgi:DUF4097 and DUF4098 domain-containing protein YvlB
MRISLVAVALGTMFVLPSAALAQRFPFERAFDVAAVPTLDVSTLRGKIEVTAGEPGRIVIEGTVTVRTDWDVPANAVELARGVVNQPPVERAGNTVRLRPPADGAERRAVTVSYRVHVPRDTRVAIVTDSGETTVRDISGAVSVQTQSAAIDVSGLGSEVTIKTGSGAVSVDRVGGVLAVTTGSSSVTARSLDGDVSVRTASGAVDLTLSGGGAADVETGSSGIRMAGIRGALTATTNSGRVIVSGAPAAPWRISTGSGSVELSLARSGMTIDATTGSGSIQLAGVSVVGTTSKRSVKGPVGGGGPDVTIKSRSGSIRLKDRG